MRKPTEPANETPMVGLEQYYDEFRQSRINDLNLIHNALSAADYTAISGFAHKWRGYCAPYGFGLLAEIAHELEMAAEVNDQIKCQQLAEEAHIYLHITKKKGDS